MAEIDKILGYKVKDLMILATICMRSGITPSELHEIKDMCQWCYEVISKDFHDSMDRAIQYQIAQRSEVCLDKMELECGQDGRTM